jgi:hypothetical protein
MWLEGRTRKRGTRLLHLDDVIISSFGTVVAGVREGYA